MHMNLRRFAGLQTEEVVLSRVRQFWVCALPLFFVGACLIFFTSFWFFSFLKLGLFGGLMIAFGSVLGLFCCFSAYASWVDTLLIVTDQRVLLIVRQWNWRIRRVEFTYAEISSVKARRMGLLDRLLSLGSVMIELVDEEEEIFFPHLKQFLSLQKFIEHTRLQVLLYSHHPHGMMVSE